MTINEDLDLDPKTIANAQNGDSSAQFTVGIAYYHATRVENNCYKAFKWINASAEQGDREAQFKLADMYALGHGTARNLVTAHEWYTKSALQDYPKALIRIHNLYVEDKNIHSRGELNSEEEGMNELEFKKSNSVRELNEYRLNLLQAKNILGGTMEFFLKKFKFLRESKIDNDDINHTLGFLYKHGYGIRRISKQAIVFYTKAAEKGHTSAQYNLAYLYQHSHNIKFNYRYAFKWYSKAAEGGSSAAQNNLGYFYEKGLVVDVDFQKALHWYTQAAQKNNKGAMLNIARLYRKGFLDDPDHSKLIRWYTMASEKGSLIAKNCLSLLSQKPNIAEFASYTGGTFVETEPLVKSRIHSRLRLDVSNLINPEKRNQIEKLASHALIGDGHAMLELGFKYFDGIDLTQDKDTGFKWIQKAARTNIIKAQLIVAKMYEEGEIGVVKQDYYKAFLWYSLAAKQKSNVAQYNLGSLYFKGHGVRKDPLEASKWFIWSADQGNSNAQYMLGIMRLEEDGVLRKDPAEAFEWFTKSAIQRNAKALYQLGQIYWEGKVLENEKQRKKNEKKREKNEKRAILFYKYAACHGDIDSGLSLAKMYSEGNAYIDRDFFEALEYYLKVAKQGDSGSMYKAGCMLLEGDAGVQDHIKAFHLINQAAKNGSYEAQGLFGTPLLYSGSISDYANVLDMFKVVTLTKTADLRYNIGCFYEYGIRGFNNITLIKPNSEKALEWYEKAAKKNNPDALYKLGLIHQEGKIVERNMSTAAEYYTRASQFSNVDSLFALATIYLLGINVDKDVVRAFHLYFDAATSGHQKSRNMLSIMYGFEESSDIIYMKLEVKDMIEEVASTGNIIAQYHLGVYYESRHNIGSAVKWYTLAAKGKIAEACFRLATIHEKDGEYENYSRSIELYKVIIENGHDDALFRLARMYHYGKGVPRDYSKAFQMYNDASDLGNKSAYRVLNISDEHNGSIKEEANKSSFFLEDLQECLLMYEHVAANGNVDFQYRVGYIYEKVLEPPELQNASKWYTMAAYNSHGEAACRLGQMYSEGKGVSQDCSIAIRYFNQSIPLGSHNGCFHLGQVYHKGNGVDVNISKALEYYHKAAEKSNPNAQFMLGQLCESTGEQNNLLEALEWYTKAYFQEQDGAISRLCEWEDDRHKGVHYSKRLLNKLQKFADNHGGKRKITDPEYYGHKYYLLAYMHFSGIATSVNYTKAWKYFDIARQEYSNKEAIAFINSVAQDADTSQQPIFNSLIEMFNVMIEKLDKELLYNIGVIYNNKRSLSDTIQQNHSMAFKFLRKSLEKGHPKAQKKLLKMYTSGIRVDENSKVAIQNHSILVEKQDYFDNLELGSFYYHAIQDKETSYSIALIYFQKAVEQGYGDAQKYLGDMYYYGYGVKPDLENSIKLHKLSAGQRSASENFDIGAQYYKGSINLKKNFLVALIYFSSSISRKSLDSQKYIEDICCYRNKDIVRDNTIRRDNDKTLLRLRLHTHFASFLDGDLSFRIGFRYYQAFEKVKKNYLVAIIYFERSVEQGNAEAQRYLGDMYYYGYGVKKNRDKALELHTLSINQRNNEDRTFIGRQYYQGSDFVIKNYSIAYKYFTEAADEEYYEAQRYLGDMYYHGHHVEKDHENALRLHKCSANQQTSKDNFFIGREYLRPTNTKLDYIVALIYLNQSINQGYTSALEYIIKICYSSATDDRKNKSDLEIHGVFSKHINGYSNFKVGQAYYHKEGYVDDKIHSLAFVYFNSALAQNYYDAQRYIADMYYYGKSVKENRQKAIELHTHSADQKQDFDNYKTGQLYYHGDKKTPKNYTVAFIYFNKAANQNHLEAQRYLAEMYYYGEGIRQDREEAIRMHKFLAEQKEGVDNYKAGQLYYRSDKYTQENYLVAFIYFSKAAAQNHVEAKRRLADMFYYGEGVGPNQEKAVEMHTSLANQEHGFSNYETGQLYYHGKKKIQKNLKVALIYFHKAASQKHIKALRHLADMYYYGNSVEKNHEKAIELYISSTKQGEGFDNCETGQLYYFGRRGYKKSHEIAHIYFSKAAVQNHDDAQRCLADMYYWGEGVEENHEKAIEIHKCLAERKQENSSDNYEKGQLYYSGNANVKKNLKIALIYFSEAANQNHPGSQRILADMHYYGKDIKKNHGKAIDLYTSSAKEGQGIENYEIGQSYYYGYGNVTINRTAAIIYFRQAEAQNHSGAQRFLADRYYYGETVEEDREKAMELYTSSAKQEQGSENFKIGREYYLGEINGKKNYLVALIYFNEAAAQNHPDAHRFLADMYCYGEGVKQDYDKSIELYTSSAELGNSSENYEAGQLYYHGKGDTQKNLAVALIYFIKAATQDHSGAHRYLAHMYYYGEGVEENREEAIKLFKSSAELGNYMDNYTGCELYYVGEENIQKNLEVALIYLNKAVTQRKPHAQRYLADMYYYGEGVEENREEAIQLYKSSAEIRGSSYNYETGQLYYKGEGNTRKSFAIASIYFSKAATQNHPGAQRYLADMYYYGEGVGKNREKAIKLHKSSAELGNSHDNYEIGLMYYDGKVETRKNFPIALIYFENAASQHHLRAQKYLADMYYYGIGVKRNEERARELYKSFSS